MEYFNRLWIVEELALGKRVEFLCGSHRFTWSQMKLLFEGGTQLPGILRNTARGLQINNVAFSVQNVVRPSDLNWLYQLR